MAEELKEEPTLELEKPIKFVCPVCKETVDVITSTIPKAPGHWCMVCALKWMSLNVPMAVPVAAEVGEE